jgi:SAM-dependent methyltransferase
MAFKRRVTGEAAAYERLAVAQRERDELQRRLAELAPLEAIPWRREHRPPWPRPGAATRRFAAELGDWQPDLDGLDDLVRAHWAQADEHGRTFMRVRLAVWQDAPGFCERTGLSRADPPPEVHAMARGPLAAAGGLNAADLVADSLELAGVPLAGLAPARALDFGGSSGRVARVLAAAFRDVEWHSCDPNGAAVAWGREHLPAVTFHESPQEPPLPFEDESFGLVYAISVWSHLSERAALRWFAEMHRIIAPGGLLVPTVQSWNTTHHLATRGLWDVADVREGVADMYERGHHFRRTFGPGGDFGVESPDWGFATLSAEWLARHLTPDWELLLWRSGAHEADQDAVVLRRAR